jgi:hypothetical protein
MKAIYIEKMRDTLDKMSIAPAKIINDLDHHLDDILNAIKNYNEVMVRHIAGLKEEGLTAMEETTLSRSMIRMRNAVIVEYIDLL